MAHPEYLSDLASTVYENLENQHDWTLLESHTHKQAQDKTLLPRPLITGLPLAVELVKTHATYTVEETPEIEWVVPMHLNEKLTLKQLAAVFDSVELSEPLAEGRCKRLLMAIVHDDSTVVYYFVHDGIVKPRQN
ncbi:tRNA-splicing endonuclease subunit sen-15 protein [Apiospora kogelbergensis]|uniref:tRNA-splicing endonuclease subunit sen-15 protein n=1 Tax=Apiospora kogelbergensis TaxID=1337665 RepID=A0AAW0R3S3_9PEZI